MKQGPQKVKEHQLFEVKKRLEKAMPKTKVLKPVRENSARKQKLKLGDEVYVPQFQQKGTIVEVLGKGEYQVQIGIMKMKLHRNQLEKRESSQKKETQKMVTSLRKQLWM